MEKKQSSIYWLKKAFNTYTPNLYRDWDNYYDVVHTMPIYQDFDDLSDELDLVIPNRTI